MHDLMIKWSNDNDDTNDINDIMTTMSWNAFKTCLADINDMYKWQKAFKKLENTKNSKWGRTHWPTEWLIGRVARDKNLVLSYLSALGLIWKIFSNPSFSSCIF